MEDIARSDSERRFRRRAIGTIVVLTLWAVLLSSVFLSLANDMYAFVKQDTEVTLEISEPLSPWGFSSLLSSEGILNNPTFFFLYLHSKGKTELIGSLTGTIHLNSSMSYREIMEVLKKASPS